MTNQLSQIDIEKLKAKIDLSLVSKFDIKDMESDAFIPVCIFKDTVLIASSNTTLTEKLNNMIAFITDNSNIKVINI